MSGKDDNRTTNMVHYPGKDATDPNALDVYLDGIVSTAATNTSDISTIVNGLQELWLPASVWLDNAGTPPYALVTMAVGPLPVFTFDPTTPEYVWYSWAPPKRWDNGTIQFQVYWSLDSVGTNAVVWQLEAGAHSDDDSIANLFSAAAVTDSGTGADGDLQISAKSSALTVANTPATGDLIKFTFLRNAVDAADTATVDAHFIGLKIFWTANAGSDD